MRSMFVSLCLHHCFLLLLYWQQQKLRQDRLAVFGLCASLDNWTTFCRLGPCSKAVMDRVLSSDHRLDELSGGSLTWPDSLIIAVLEREHMLAQARLHELNFERVTKEIHIYHLRRLLHLVGDRERPASVLCLQCCLECCLTEATGSCSIQPR